jgi:hypothetical protein
VPENMMNSDHKATNKNYRDNYDKIFGKKGETKNEDSDRNERNADR